MGIQHLNRFFREKTGNALKVISIAEMSGKKIAVDISIYMYRFLADDSLIENMYMMLSVFRHYNVTPIFIFDGKPPKEKKELLIKRREDKKEAEEEYTQKLDILNNNCSMDDSEKKELITNMDILKRKFIHISKNDIENVKRLIRAYGASYFDAPGEADDLCAMLAVKGKVWACLSEDMDMFVYGCPRVIRYISLLNHSAILYDMTKILEILGITQKEFREICVLSGTDYNNDTDISHNIFETMNQFKNYKEFTSPQSEEDFYTWLMNNTNYIEDLKLLQKVTKINNMFDLSNPYSSQLIEKITILNGYVQKDEIKSILKNDGFIFPM
jgi:flap endonuclease-1